MSDAEAKRRLLHVKIDSLCDALSEADRSGKAFERWCVALSELIDVATRATRQRRHGRVFFEAPISEGLPTPQRGIETGFITSLK